MTEIQLQKKFKHASDFGIIGNYNNINAKAFEEVLSDHFFDKHTERIRGTYKGDTVNHYYNKVTKVNVICKDKRFLSGWKLSSMQQFHILTTGSL